MRPTGWLSVIGGCAIVAACLGYYKYAEIQSAVARAKAFPEPVEAVELFIVEEVQYAPRVSVSGEVVATQSADLRNELEGRIVSVGFAPGAKVVTGQVLLQLDVTEERAQLAAAKADRQIAQLALERARSLVSRGAGSVEARDRARAQADAAAARADALTAVIAKKTLRAPFAATTSLHRLEVGQYLEAATTVAQLVGHSDTVWIDFSLPQQQTAVNVGTNVTIVAQDLGTAALPASIIARDPNISAQSRNLRFRAAANNTQARLIPGSLVNVHIALASEDTVVLVPTAAVRRSTFGTRVFVLETVEENGQSKERARSRSVIVGGNSTVTLEDMLIVSSGLSAGERIAANGAFKLRDGVLVNAEPQDPSIARRKVGF
jgi:membrane fusion protein (multidrug efflux system)